MNSRLLAAAAFLAASTTAHALPELQLAIPGGSYNSTTETTVAAGQSFTLFALFDPKKDDLATLFYISAALELGGGDSPVTGSVLNGGVFTFAGNTINVTSDMVQGTPGGLPTHGDFATWYYLSAPFTFSAANQTTPFDAQTTHPATISGGCTVNCIYFQSFAVNTSLLNANYSIHFDLFDAATLGGAANGVNAPFSHDAQSLVGGCRNGQCVSQLTVPEPGSLALLGLALGGMALSFRRSRQH